MMKLKRFMSETSSCALLAVLASLLLVQETHAYLDPGAGSYILQILIASLFGALFMLKVFWAGRHFSQLYSAGVRKRVW